MEWNYFLSTKMRGLYKKIVFLFKFFDLTSDFLGDILLEPTEKTF